MGYIWYDGNVKNCVYVSNETQCREGVKMQWSIR